MPLDLMVPNLVLNPHSVHIPEMGQIILLHDFFSLSCLELSQLLLSSALLLNLSFHLGWGKNVVSELGIALSGSVVEFPNLVIHLEPLRNVNFLSLV